MVQPAAAIVAGVMPVVSQTRLVVAKLFTPVAPVTPVQPNKMVLALATPATNKQPTINNRSFFIFLTLLLRIEFVTSSLRYRPAAAFDA
jgi:hypothetical protein